ncbi:ferritin-like domain-containing protein [Nocardioides mangrovicus]|uniref:ferritin-like domain-containing protein n=1 Tax=Nocardioides mangrovicus TaxID=2478913 RepID=UPI001314E0AA|nr:ferritin-like domain-containing protein [Nocardioides mangrovicus]
MADSPSDTTQALQDTLAGEHAACYVFTVLVAQTSEGAQPTLFGQLDDAFTWHRTQRDDLVARITAAGATPVAASPSYVLPNAAADQQQIVRAALTIERRIADTYGTLVASTSGENRRLAVVAMQSCAVRQLTFGGRPETWPGTSGLGAKASD